MRGGGGITEFMNLRGNDSDDTYAGRFFYDVFFFVLVNLILLGIFFGIIVDSFAVFRDRLTKRQNDKKNVCFTCGLQRSHLEKSGLDFDKHV